MELKFELNTALTVKCISAVASATPHNTPLEKTDRDHWCWYHCNDSSCQELGSFGGVTSGAVGVEAFSEYYYF
jgi:hypothetical protein